LYLFSRYDILILSGRRINLIPYFIYSFPMTLELTQNTELLRRISITGLHLDDAREILRIFPVLTEEKQLHIFETWDTVVASIKLHRDELEQEKKILLVQALEDIESDLEAYNRKQIQKTTKQEMESFQKNI